ncbi:MAG TPA: branched-chain amino acid transaminase [Candidatus Hydrogenedentes bacterium]|nr:branched-chain amino acid transaminase [Candidatus Hydrogenedentota bacterium]
MGIDLKPGETAYFEGSYVPIEEAKVSIMTHAFNYGTGLFEGIRGYYAKDEDNILIFRLREHVERFVRNFNVLCMEVPETQEQIEEVCVELVRRSGFREDVYIRPICYKSELSLGPLVKGVASSFCCYVTKLGDYVDTQSGLDVAVTSWRRLSDNAIPTRTKCTGSYINSALAASEVKKRGFDDAVFLREDGTVSEGSGMNIFMVTEGVLVTPPRTADILVGITRNSVLELAAAELGIPVVERPIARTELYVADELFFTGTAAQVAPVRSVDERLIGDGTPGPISLRLQELFFRVVKGKVDTYRHWCTPAYA